MNGHAVSVVGTDRAVTRDPYPADKGRIGGFTIVDVPSRDEALAWAARIAVACRCAQDVRELLPDSLEDFLEQLPGNATAQRS